MHKRITDILERLAALGFTDENITSLNIQAENGVPAVITLYTTMEHLVLIQRWHVDDTELKVVSRTQEI